MRYSLWSMLLGPYLVIISFSSTARIPLELPHAKPLFTLSMLRRPRDTETRQCTAWGSNITRTGLDWNPNSARTMLSHAHQSAQAGFLKTL